NCRGNALQLAEALERVRSSNPELVAGRHIIEAAAEDQGNVPLLGKQQVSLLEQLAQDRPGIAVPALPQLCAEVAVKGNRDPSRPRRTCSAHRSLGRLRSDGGGDPRQV